MFRNWAKWRKDEDIDQIVVNPNFPFKEALLKAHPHGNHGIDKLGRPVWIDRVGVMDVNEMLEACTLDESFRYEYWDYEMQLRFRMPVCSIIAGKKIQTGMNIVDLTEWKMSMFNSQVIGILKRCGQVMSDYYPETMGATIVINAPFLFKGVWGIAKGFIDERTAAKFRICGGDYMETLEEFIDKD